MQLSYFAFLGSTLLAAGMVAAQASNGLTVATLPAITTCIPNRLTWQGGQAPFNVFIIVPNQSSSILQSLGSTNSNFLVYTPDGRTSGVAPGDSVSVYVTDSAGFNSASAGTQVISGGTCTSSSSASSSGTGSSTAAPSTSSSSTVTTSTTSSAAPTTTTTTRSTTSSSSSSTTTTSASATPTGAAAPGLNGLTAVVAGAVGVIAAALI
ncbi:hypothetical protein V8E36_006379 [Tilletia maclaganii]